MHPSLTEVAHRPWPLPTAPWTWQQSWLDLAFLHYPVPVEKIAPLLPRGLKPQQFGGTAWLGVVPFRMAGVAPRAMAKLFSLPSFPELNLRTYVETEDKPGVWFFSLDAASRLVVLGGRQVFGLPYFNASMRQIHRDGWMTFQSARRGAAASFCGRYRALGPQLKVEPGSFEHWASERYALYVLSPHGTLQRMQVHHAPWPLYRAEVELTDLSVIRAAGLEVSNTPPICHCSPGVNVVAFGPEPLNRPHESHGAP